MNLSVEDFKQLLLELYLAQRELAAVKAAGDELAKRFEESSE